MHRLTLKVQRFLASEDGPTAVEYAVMLALIVVVCITAIQAVHSLAVGANLLPPRNCSIHSTIGAFNLINPILTGHEI